MTPRCQPPGHYNLRTDGFAAAGYGTATVLEPASVCLLPAGLLVLTRLRL